MKKSFILKTILFACVVALTVTSCSDDEAKKTKTDLLTQQTWKFSSALPADDLATQILAIFYKDSEYTFKKDKTYSGVFLSLPLSGKWEFSSDESKLVLDKNTSGEETYELTTLDDSKLEITTTTDSGTKLTLVFVKK